MAFFRVVSMRKPVQTVASDAGTTSDSACLRPAGAWVEKSIASPVPTAPRKSEADEAHDRLDLALDVGLAHRAEEEARDHEPLHQDCHHHDQSQHRGRRGAGG